MLCISSCAVANTLQRLLSERKPNKVMSHKVKPSAARASRASLSPIISIRYKHKQCSIWFVVLTRI